MPLLCMGLPVSWCHHRPTHHPSSSRSPSNQALGSTLHPPSLHKHSRSPSQMRYTCCLSSYAALDISAVVWEIVLFLLSLLSFLSFPCSFSFTFPTLPTSSPLPSSPPPSPPPPLSPSPTTTQYANAILGPGGSQLQQIRYVDLWPKLYPVVTPPPPPPPQPRAQSSCDISINDPKPGSMERIITIVGTPNGIQFAQQLMQTRSDLLYWMSLISAYICVENIDQ